MLALLTLAGINCILAGVILWQVAMILVELREITNFYLPRKDLNEVCLQEDSTSDHGGRYGKP